MKKSILFALSALLSFALQAENKDYYESIFNGEIDNFKVGYATNADFEEALSTLNSLEEELTAEKTNFKEKAELLTNIKAVHAFIGEIGPEVKSYSLTLTQKDIAMSLLGISEEMYDESNYCLPIKKISLWDDKYNCYMLDNKSDSMMYVYKFNFLVQKKFSSFNGMVEGGVSKDCSRSIYDAFGNAILKFTQEKCEPQIQVVTYIEQEAIIPEVEKYAEPDYLTPEQKKALKKREVEKAKQEKERQKQAVKREKEKAKKLSDKEKAQKKKEAEKAKAQKKKETEQAKVQKKKELEQAKKEKQTNK
jgi:hypothetical protein